MTDPDYVAKHGDDLARAVQDVDPEHVPADGEDATEDDDPMPRGQWGPEADLGEG